jgi:hypothetical protein
MFNISEAERLLENMCNTDLVVVWHMFNISEAERLLENMCNTDLVVVWHMLNISEAERLLENMRDFEESLRVSLSARRLEINKLELMLQISSFGVTLGTLVSGIFGMNLRSNIEEHAFAFVWATCGIVAGIVLVSVLLYAYVGLRQKIVEGVHKAYKAEIRTDPSPPIPGQDYNNSGYGEDSRDGSRMFDGMHTAYEGYQD